MRTQVGIIGAGPAGLTLAHLLRKNGIECVILESRSREYVENRVRAGVLEQGTVKLLRKLGLAERLDKIGLEHRGIELRFHGERHRIDFADLTGGKTITVYGQQEVVKDLTSAWLTGGGELLFEAEAVAVEGMHSNAPLIRYRHNGHEHKLHCEFVIGCDGFHGVSRRSIPAEAMRIYEHVHPMGWLGILADAPPATDELIYASHDRGFALHSLRSDTVSRLYLQCRADEKLDEWPDSRIWDELERRLETRGDWTLRRGPITEKSVTQLRSFVVDPMQYGRLFLVGDAAHIVPPTGAKGLNLAVADACVLARALTVFFREKTTALLDDYSKVCLRRVWKVQYFSWWMTELLHIHPGGDNGIRRPLQLAQLDYVTSSRAAATMLAEHYVGLPLEIDI